MAWKRHHCRTKREGKKHASILYSNFYCAEGVASNCLSFNLTCCLTWCHNPQLHVRSTVYFMRKTLCNQKLCCRKKQVLWKCFTLKKCSAKLLVAEIHWDLGTAVGPKEKHKFHVLWIFICITSTSRPGKTILPICCYLIYG